MRPAKRGAYLEFELNDLKQELAGITQAHLPVWIDEVQLDAAVAHGSVFLLMDESNVATVEEMSNRLLNPGPQTLVFRASPTASFTITLYDWTSDYARRYEKASGDPFLRMNLLTNACAPQQAEAPATPEYRTPERHRRQAEVAEAKFCCERHLEAAAAPCGSMFSRVRGGDCAWFKPCRWWALLSSRGQTRLNISDDSLRSRSLQITPTLGTIHQLRATMKTIFISLLLLVPSAAVAKPERGPSTPSGMRSESR